MAASLHLVFSQGNSSRTVAVSEPKAALTRGEVQKAMEDIVSLRTLLAGKKPVDAVKAAYLSEIVITELDAA
ncbi:MAG: DUF2922 family protein [Anaerovibrio sp.]|nr:DUF2922 family protein [Anaerovibrio sp.]